MSNTVFTINIERKSSVCVHNVNQGVYTKEDTL